MRYYCDILTKAQRTAVLVTPVEFVNHKQEDYKDKRTLLYKILCEIFCCEHEEAMWFHDKLSPDDCWVNYRENDKQFRLNVWFPTMDEYVSLMQLKPVLSQQRVDRFYVCAYIPWEFQPKREALEKEIIEWKELNGYDFKHKIDYDCDDMIVTMKKATAPPGTRRLIMSSNLPNLIHFAIKQCKGKVTALTTALGIKKGVNLRDTKNQRLKDSTEAEVGNDFAKAQGDLRERLIRTIENSQKKAKKHEDTFHTPTHEDVNNAGVRKELFGDKDHKVVEADPRDGDGDALELNISQAEKISMECDDDDWGEESRTKRPKPDRKTIMDRIGAKQLPGNEGKYNIENNASLNLKFNTYKDLDNFIDFITLFALDNDIRVVNGEKYHEDIVIVSAGLQLS